MGKFSKIFGAILLISLMTGCTLFRTAPPLRQVPPKSRPPLVLLSFFPQKPKTEWIYQGFAEYGHRMALNSVVRSRDGSRIVHHISGRVEDMSGGESTRNFHFKLRYTFTRNAVYETLVSADTPFPHRIQNLKLLTLPLRKGVKWTQKVTMGGKKSTLRAEVMDYGARPDLGSKIVKVRYRVPMAGMPNGIYEEIREFAWRKGVYRFEKTFDPDPAIRFQYILREVKIP